MIAAGADERAGKKPNWTLQDAWGDIPARPAPIGASITDSPEAALMQEPEGAVHGMMAPFSSLANAVAFIQAQRGLGGAGLPATFRVPPGIGFTDPLRRLIVTEGVGLYDTALAVITLVEAGRLNDARNILDYYVAGRYADGTPSPMELRALPSGINNNAFRPFNEDAYYFFDFTNLHGNWLRWGDQWKFWGTHTGPNAWLINALLRYVAAIQKTGAAPAAYQPYLDLAQTLGQAMRRLQDKDTGGAVRYSPKDVWHEETASDPHLELNMENNISAYTAFRMLATATGKKEYAESADAILLWMKNSGLYDAREGVLRMGVEWKKKRWEIQPVVATDSAGTWTISALGAEKIDRLWGAKAAYRMWTAIRARVGRTAAFGLIQEGQMLAGLDFTDAFPPNELMISPEWSAGGVFALRELERYYAHGGGQGVLSAAELNGLRRDTKTIVEFLSRNPNAYAIGPGHAGTRQGATGFRWFSPPVEVHAMASLYFALAVSQSRDPLAAWR